MSRERDGFGVAPQAAPGGTAPARRAPLEVEWVDSASVNGGLWVARDDISPEVMTNEGLTQKTVGYVVEQSNDVLLLAQSIGADRLGAVLAIPLRCVLHMRVALPDGSALEATAEDAS